MHLILQNGIGLASFHFRNLYTSGSRVLYLPSTNSITLPFWFPPNSQPFITILKFFALHVAGPTLAKIAKSLSGLMLTNLPLESLVTLDILDRKSTRLNSSHVKTSYAVSCVKHNT